MQSEKSRNLQKLFREVRVNKTFSLHTQDIFHSVNSLLNAFVITSSFVGAICGYLLWAFNILFHSPLWSPRIQLLEPHPFIPWTRRIPLAPFSFTFCTSSIYTFQTSSNSIHPLDILQSPSGPLPNIDRTSAKPFPNTLQSSSIHLLNLFQTPSGFFPFNLWTSSVHL